MALRITLETKNLLANTLVKALTGTTGTNGGALMKFYNGPQPVSADDATSGTCLGTIGAPQGKLVGVSWGGSNGTVCSTSGTAALGGTGGFTGTMGTAGTVVWARITPGAEGTGFFSSAGTFALDGDVGTASTSTFVINTMVFSNTGAFNLIGMNLAIG